MKLGPACLCTRPCTAADDRVVGLRRRRVEHWVLLTMHLLSSHNRSEFLATPQLIRFDHVDGHRNREPTLLIKASTLLLKYIVKGVGMQLFFALMGNRLLYALRVKDDEKRPCILWSVLERDEEKAALIALAQGEHCQIFLFNELAVNVAQASRPLTADKGLTEMVAKAAMGPVDHAALRTNASVILAQLSNDEMVRSELIATDLLNTIDWTSIHSHFVTSHLTASPIDIFERDEGSQQEQLAVWLTDGLQPLGVHLSPQIPKGKGSRELTDILLSHQYGSILLESKTLAVFKRDSLPGRTKLGRDVSGHIKKAIRQIKGGICRLRNGCPVTSTSGLEIDVERTQPAHAIVMIPDLDLIEDREAYGLSMIRDFGKATDGFIHIVDISELLRIVRAAERSSTNSENVTPMMAFDYYLIQRAKEACEAGTLCIEVLHRFTGQ